MSTSIISHNNHVVLNETTVVVNGITYDKPGMGNLLCMIDSVIYVNGFVFRKGKFKRSFRAVFYNYVM